MAEHLSQYFTTAAAAASTVIFPAVTGSLPSTLSHFPHCCCCRNHCCPSCDPCCYWQLAALVPLRSLPLLLLLPLTLISSQLSVSSLKRLSFADLSTTRLSSSLSLSLSEPARNLCKHQDKINKMQWMEESSSLGACEL
jgi:hypothetical protein